MSWIRAAATPPNSSHCHVCRRAGGRKVRGRGDLLDPPGRADPLASVQPHRKGSLGFLPPPCRPLDLRTARPAVSGRPLASEAGGRASLLQGYGGSRRIRAARRGAQRARENPPGKTLPPEAPFAVPPGEGEGRRYRLGHGDLYDVACVGLARLLIEIDVHGTVRVVDGVAV